MIYIFTNVYKFKDDEEFIKSLYTLPIKQEDKFVFLNTFVPLRHALDFFYTKDVILLHRRKGDKPYWFGYEDSIHLPLAKVLRWRPDDKGNVIDDKGNIVWKVDFSKYPNGHVPTTGWVANELMSEMFPSEPITLINYYGNADNSTRKVKAHNWVWEDRFFRSLSNKKYLAPNIEIVYVGDDHYLSYLSMSVQTYRFFNPTAHITCVSPRPMRCPDGIDNIVMSPPEGMPHRVNDRVTDTTYLKLHLPELPYDKIILVDPDTLCMKPLEDLWAKDCPYISLCESHIYGEKQAREFGHLHYGLSGVMVMNLKAMREDNFTTKAYEPFDTSFISYWCHEESILNKLFYNKMTFIERKYNYCYGRKYRMPLQEKDISILHFPGSDKKNMKLLYSRFIENMNPKGSVVSPTVSARNRAIKSTSRIKYKIVSRCHSLHHRGIRRLPRLA